MLAAAARQREGIVTAEASALAEALTHNMGAEAILGQDRIVASAEFPDSFRFAFTLVVPEELGGSQVYYELMPYRLEMYESEGDTVRLASQYSGLVNLTVSEEQAGTWAVSRWVDFRDDSENRTLGYLYALMPVGAGALVMLAVALLVNNLAPRRRYPEFWW